MVLPVLRLWRREAAASKEAQRSVGSPAVVHRETAGGDTFGYLWARDVRRRIEIAADYPLRHGPTCPDT